MQEPQSALSESFILAEYKRVSGLYIHNATMAERRVNIHLVLLGAGIGLLGLPKLLGRPGSLVTTTPTALLPSLDEKQLLILALVITIFLLTEGVLTFHRVIDRRIKAVEYLRAINRLSRYFAERDPELSKYLFLPPRDDVPQFEERAHAVADLRDLVAILSSLYFGALVIDISMLTVPGGPASLKWSAALFSFGIGTAAAFASWLLHSWYEKRVLAKAVLAASANIRFPGMPATPASTLKTGDAEIPTRKKSGSIEKNGA